MSKMAKCSRTARARCLSSLGDYYTVETQEAANRGVQRIVVGGDGAEYYYTPDHYGSFQQFNPGS